jgi:hypothetical protein
MKNYEQCKQEIRDLNELWKNANDKWKRLEEYRINETRVEEIIRLEKLINEQKDIKKEFEKQLEIVRNECYSNACYLIIILYSIIIRYYMNGDFNCIDNQDIFCFKEIDIEKYITPNNLEQLKAVIRFEPSVHIIKRALPKLFEHLKKRNVISEKNGIYHMQLQLIAFN